MAKINFTDIMRSKNIDPSTFQFDHLTINPMSCYLTQQDIDALGKIATSIKLNSKIDEKRRLIEEIMVPRGFKYLGAGTNRIVYRHIEDNRFVAKIAVDRVGMGDNPSEYKNQFMIRPFIAKMFEVSSNGVIGFAERVEPITTKEEFINISDQVFDILIYRILGRYVIGDVGSKFFMNWGLRKLYAFGPVLLDYPYVYPLSGKKIYCTKVDLITGIPCNGEIDYDIGFNHLVCSKCGKIYGPRDLEDDSINNTLVIQKGGNVQMKVRIVRGEETLAVHNTETESVVRKKTMIPEPKNTLKIRVKLGSNVSSATKAALGITDGEPDITESKVKADTTLIKEVKKEPVHEEIKQEKVAEKPEEVKLTWPSLGFMVTNFRDELEHANIPQNIHDDIIDDFENEYIRIKNESDVDSDEELKKVVDSFRKEYLSKVLEAYKICLNDETKEDKVVETIDESSTNDVEADDKSESQEIAPSDDKIDRIRNMVNDKFMQYFRTRKRKIDMEAIIKAQDKVIAFYMENYTELSDTDIKEKISEVFNHAINSAKLKSKFIPN